MADTTPKFNLKYGESDYLKNVELSAGTISVTTDTHSMYIDLPVKDNGTGTTEVKRFRVSDFEKYADLKALADDSKNWYIGSLALIENITDVDGEENQPSQAPILAYYNGNSWININDTADLKKGIEDLQKEIEDILGTGTDGDPTSIAGLNKKIEDEIDRAEAAEEGLDRRISTIEGDYLKNEDKEALNNRIDVIEEDYLKNEDKEALNNRIGVIEEDYLKNEDKENLEAANTSLSNRIGVIEGDYLKKADKDALSGRISTIEGDYLKKADKDELATANTTLSEKIQTLLGGVNEPDKGQSVRDIAIDELAKQLIPENAAESLDTLQEIAAWIQEHPEDAADMNEKILTLEGILTGLGPNEEDPYKTVVNFVNSVKTELQAEILAVNNQFYWQPFTTTTTE